MKRGIQVLSVVAVMLAASATITVRPQGFGVMSLAAGITVAPLTAQPEPDCFDCKLRDNDWIPAKGWVCSEGPDECHLHDEEIPQTTDVFWPNDHPLGVWLDDPCHNLCDDDSSVAAVQPHELLRVAGAVSRAIRSDGVPPSVAAATFSTELVEVAYDPRLMSMLVKGAGACKRMVPIPVPRATSVTERVVVTQVVVRFHRPVASNETPS